MCLWVPVGFVLRDGWSCTKVWNISGKAAATVHFAPPVTLIPIRSVVAAETAGVREGPISICLFLLSLPHHISRVMGLKIMYNGVMEMCSLEENLRQVFFKVLDSPLSWTQQIQLLHSETLRVGAQRPESSEVPPLFAFPWCMRRDDVHSPVLSNSAFDIWTLCSQDRIKIKLNWTAKGS